MAKVTLKSEKIQGLLSKHLDNQVSLGVEKWEGGQFGILCLFGETF